MVHASASVTVNGQVTSRKGEYFWKEVSANNTNSVVYLGITNQAVLAGTTNNATGNLLLPMAGQRYWYDADGNMLSDGVWTNTWDAENRLVSTETTAAVPEVARAKEIWSYYADGRWSERAVYAWTNGNWVAQATQRFVWDGNVIVAIVDGNNGLLQTFLRGLDLSGTMQGAGGAGGLLAIGDVPSVMTSFYVHDGNGNVVALVSASDGSVVARYEYGPFGEPIRMTGPMAQVSPMRFSGQFTDDTRTTVKCLFRDYSCATGRWCSRDPISENGGPNLYAAVANHPIGSSDRFGKTILGPDGDTSRFGPLDLAATIPTFWITVTKVEIPDGGCACLLDEASWDTRVHIYYNASVTGGSALVTLAEITMHEMVHAIADEEWARKALPAEIGLCSIICGCLQVHGGGCVGFS